MCLKVHGKCYNLEKTLYHWMMSKLRYNFQMPICWSNLVKYRNNIPHPCHLKTRLWLPVLDTLPWASHPHLYLLIICGDHGLSRRPTVRAGTRNSGPGHIPGVSMDGNRLIKQHSILLPRTKSMRCMMNFASFCKIRIFFFTFFFICWN